ncbi:MAG: DUF4876 domain-containing protein [Bacteroidales bacterium]|nr:DUF4876 domain-containing protein [Bacteroidales bacterium]MCL2133261.1 DUF4876 domain-containing protein [Bacteroidales bacterium]
MKKILFLLIYTLLWGSCLNEDQASSVFTFKIIAALPEDFTLDVDMTKISVRIQSREKPVTYQQFLEEDGTALFTVEPGRYSATISSRTPDGIFNGLESEFLLTTYGVVGADKSDVSNSLTINLEVAAPGGLIFREIYYVGSQTQLGSNYSRDIYVELYNNTDQDILLDSLCFGAIYPANGISSTFNWVGMDTIAIFQMLWMFPGTGQDYPLGPGESAVIAQNAIDHTGLCTSNLNLSKAHFGIYDPLLTGHEKHPDVPAMIRIVDGQGSAYSLSVNSPAVVVFRPAMGVRAYLNDEDKWLRYQPGSTSGTRYWHIAKSWILDGVDCSNGPTINVKRFPVSVDAGFAYTVGSYSGRCVRRKVEEVLPDRIVYQDTNNSSEDFEMTVIPSPRLRP